MTDILFIKTSSLGDVIHNMPAVTEARRARPDARLSWLVEEAFAPLVRLHPAVDEVIPVAWRRWRKSLYSPGTLAEISGNLSAIRARKYDEIIDSQGLLRSGVIARLAQGRRHGYDRDSIREPVASMFYDVRYRVSRDLHAITRNRMLSGLALGYKPQGAPDYGLDRARFPRPRRSLCRAAARDGATIKTMAGAELDRAGRGARRRVGSTSCCPGATRPNASAAHAIAARLPRARVPERMPLDDVARLIAGAQFVVGVDTGLMHLAAALSVPLVAVFTGSRTSLTGPVSNGPLQVLGAEGASPSVDEVRAGIEKIAL